MNKTTDLTKLTKLHELTSLLPREIRGQSHTIPRIISAVRRGELGLTKPSRPRGSFLLLGPTGVGKTYLVRCAADLIALQRKVEEAAARNRAQDDACGAGSAGAVEEGSRQPAQDASRSPGCGEECDRQHSH